MDGLVSRGPLPRTTQPTGALSIGASVNLVHPDPSVVRHTKPPDDPPSPRRVQKGPGVNQAALRDIATAARSGRLPTTEYDKRRKTLLHSNDNHLDVELPDPDKSFLASRASRRIAFKRLRELTREQQNTKELYAAGELAEDSAGGEFGGSSGTGDGGGGGGGGGDGDGGSGRGQGAGQMSLEEAAAADRAARGVDFKLRGPMAKLENTLKRVEAISSEVEHLLADYDGQNAAVAAREASEHALRERTRVQMAQSMYTFEEHAIQRDAALGSLEQWFATQNIGENELKESVHQAKSHLEGLVKSVELAKEGSSKLTAQYQDTLALCQTLLQSARKEDNKIDLHAYREVRYALELSTQGVESLTAQIQRNGEILSETQAALEESEREKRVLGKELRITRQDHSKQVTELEDKIMYLEAEAEQRVEQFERDIAALQSAVSDANKVQVKLETTQQQYMRVKAQSDRKGEELVRLQQELTSLKRYLARTKKPGDDDIAEDEERIAAEWNAAMEKEKERLRDALEVYHKDRFANLEAEISSLHAELEREKRKRLMTEHDLEQSNLSALANAMSQSRSSMPAGGYPGDESGSSSDEGLRLDRTQFTDGDDDEVTAVKKAAAAELTRLKADFRKKMAAREKELRTEFARERGAESARYSRGLNSRAGLRSSGSSRGGLYISLSLDDGEHELTVAQIEKIINDSRAEVERLSERLASIEGLLSDKRIEELEGRAMVNYLRDQLEASGEERAGSRGSDRSSRRSDSRQSGRGSGLGSGPDSGQHDSYDDDAEFGDNESGDGSVGGSEGGGHGPHAKPNWEDRLGGMRRSQSLVSVRQRGEVSSERMAASMSRVGLEPGGLSISVAGGEEDDAQRFRAFQLGRHARSARTLRGGGLSRHSVSDAGTPKTPYFGESDDDTLASTVLSLGGLAGRGINSGSGGGGDGADSSSSPSRSAVPDLSGGRFRPYSRGGSASVYSSRPGTSATARLSLPPLPGIDDSTEDGYTAAWSLLVNPTTSLQPDSITAAIAAIDERLAHRAAIARSCDKEVGELLAAREKAERPLQERVSRAQQTNNARLITVSEAELDTHQKETKVLVSELQASYLEPLEQSMKDVDELVRKVGGAVNELLAHDNDVRSTLASVKEHHLELRQRQSEWLESAHETIAAKLRRRRISGRRTATTATRSDLGGEDDRSDGGGSQSYSEGEGEGVIEQLYELRKLYDDLYASHEETQDRLAASLDELGRYRDQLGRVRGVVGEFVRDMASVTHTEPSLPVRMLLASMKNQEVRRDTEPEDVADTLVAVLERTLTGVTSTFRGMEKAALDAVNGREPEMQALMQRMHQQSNILMHAQVRLLEQATVRAREEKSIKVAEVLRMQDVANRRVIGQLKDRLAESNKVITSQALQLRDIRSELVMKKREVEDAQAYVEKLLDEINRLNGLEAARKAVNDKKVEREELQFQAQVAAFAHSQAVYVPPTAPSVGSTILQSSGQHAPESYGVGGAATTPLPNISNGTGSPAAPNARSESPLSPTKARVSSTSHRLSRSSGGGGGSGGSGSRKGGSRSRSAMAHRSPSPEKTVQQYSRDRSFKSSELVSVSHVTPKHVVPAAPPNSVRPSERKPRL